MDDNWRRVYRSLIFMDSWLSYTLGYNSEATPQDIQVCTNPAITTMCLTANRLLALRGAWFKTQWTR